MLPNIKLKLASIEDLSAMIKVGDKLFDHPIKPDRAKEFLNDPRHHLVVAYDGNDIVGMASGFHYVHPDKDPVLFVNEASVRDKYQNKGIGRSLIRFLCKYGKDQGFKEAWVATEQSNVAARKAYIAAGGIEDPEPIVLVEYIL